MFKYYSKTFFLLFWSFPHQIFLLSLQSTWLSERLLFKGNTCCLTNPLFSNEKCYLSLEDTHKPSMFQSYIKVILSFCWGVEPPTKFSKSGAWQELNFEKGVDGKEGVTFSVGVAIFAPQKINLNLKCLITKKVFK